MNPKLLLVPLVAGLGLLAVACSGGDTYVTSDNSGQTGINATGTGIAYGEPDIMLLTVGVSAQRDTIEAARDAAATAQNGVIQALKDNGVDEKDIQTVQFNVSPQYDYSTKPNGQGEIIGYIVSNVVNGQESVTSTRPATPSTRRPWPAATTPLYKACLSTLTTRRTSRSRPARRR